GVRRAGGFLAAGALADIKAEVSPALTTRYRGLEIASQPPITQGVVLLRALGLLQQLAPEPRRTSRAAFAVASARALRRAFDERLAILGDGPEARAQAEAILAGRAEALGRARLGFAPAARKTAQHPARDGRRNGCGRDPS